MISETEEDISPKKTKKKMTKRMFRRCMRNLMRIFVYIHDHKNNISKYSVRVDKPLKFLMNSYCQSMDLKRPEVRFIYDGSRIYGNQTPFQLSIGYKDTIEVYLMMTGGRD